MSTLLDDALSRSLRTVSRGCRYRDLNKNRIKLISFLIHAIVFDNRVPQWDLYERKAEPIPTPEIDKFIERWNTK